MPLALAALVALAAPAMAQQRVVVVPAGVDVVIPPRGAEGPALVRAPRPRLPPPGQPASGQAMTRPMLEAGGGSAAGLGLAAPALVALPLIAAAVLAGTVPGNSSSSGTSAPARTR
ncbi:hypothetical protein KTR66_09465 [Roseococcus sp. SDR]|uniref:hypothetical protein n=1 Tax=Roseococcus sp. SDR TaxID=2835532 RepID=UPI001BCCCBFD|nr:hypothetical protein [Roseococcus sp. SDR]MBS7790224.1 hypothetical protein [Roseococcus sp. SDR]MBV1845538.1 hypothetical protein [Roseococcus sp. SDR]